MQFRQAMLACVALAGCRFGFAERSELDASVDPDATADAALDPVHLRITGWGALTGPNGIACADDCIAPVGGPVTITAVAGETWAFDHFDPPCGAQPTCTVLPGQTAAATFVALPITANRAFVSSTTAVLGAGRTGLDMQCQTRATAGGLTGTFIALVSTTSQDAVDRLTGSRGWVRLDGLPILDQPAMLGLDTMPRGVMYDELMGLHPAQFVITGSNGVGRFDPGQSCSDYTVTTGSAHGAAADASMHFLIGTTSSACGGFLYCFETGKSVPVSTTPPAFPVGRYVFTVMAWDTSTGIAAADALCQSEATAVSLPGTYKAVLATTTQSVVERLGSLDGAWRRSDGVSVTRNGLRAGNFTATLSISAAGAPVPTFAALGAPSLTDRAPAGMSCSDWTANDPVAHMMNTYRMSPFSNVGQSGCATKALVCVQTP